MREDPELDWTLIDGYLAGDLTPEQTDAVERWVENDPERRVVIDQLRKNWSRIHRRRAQAVDLSALEGSMLARIANPDVAVRTTTPIGTRSSVSPQRPPSLIPSARHAPSRWGVWAGGGAAIVVMIISVTMHRGEQPASSPADAMRIYRTRPGQQATVTLPDGSHAVLGAATTVQFASTSMHASVVTVDGEALFTVTHGARAPFTVQTRTTVARVLGTQFDVRHYGSDRVTRVVVASGRVSFRSRHDAHADGAVLSARMVGTMDDSGRVNVTPNAPVEDYTAWTTGRLVFQKTPVRDVVADLSRAYGVEISLPDSALARRTLTWSLPVTRVTLSGALDVLTAVLRAHVVQSGNLITIVPGRATAAQRRVSDSLFRREHMYGR